MFRYGQLLGGMTPMRVTPPYYLYVFLRYFLCYGFLKKISVATVVYIDSDDGEDYYPVIERKNLGWLTGDGKNGNRHSFFKKKERPEITKDRGGNNNTTLESPGTENTLHSRTLKKKLSVLSCKLLEFILLIPRLTAIAM